jgi:GAF domain-containing protein
VSGAPDGGSGPEPGSQVRQAHSSEGASIDASVARDLSELARELQAETDPTAVMQRIVEAAVSEIGGAADAAITLLEHGRVLSPVHTGERATRIGQAESDTGEGPCVDTSRQEVTIRVDDLSEGSRWPAFSALAVQEGVRSLLSFQLFVEDDSMGALDVYGEGVGAFDDESENTGLLLASHAAVAMSSVRRIAALQQAVSSRDLIGQAKGILMERYKIDAQEAFNLLVLASQRANRKVRDVAEELTRTGDFRSGWPAG